MDKTREILCRAGLAKTLTQIDGIQFISIYVGDHQITAKNDVTTFSGDDFLDSVSNVNSYERAKLKLYFSDEKGEKLVEETHEVFYNINTPMEKVVINELMHGPTNTKNKKTIATDTKLINTSINDGICYVNFDTNFLTAIPNQKDYVTIYSIVNSLSEISGVSKVQISVNGSQNYKYQDDIDLSTLFERNMEYLN